MSGVSVLYFAVLRDLAGREVEQLELPEAEVTVSGILALLEARHSSLAGRLGSVRVAVNEEFRDPAWRIVGGDVVALIPPVSGG